MPKRNPPRSIRLLASLGLLAGLAIACDANEPSDAERAAENLDLSRFGVERLVADDDGFALLDAADQELGRVAVHTVDGTTELDVQLGERVAEVTWSDAGSALRCDDARRLEQSNGGEPWAPQRATTDGGNACDDALELGFEVAVASGNAPPWADQFEAVDDEDFRWLEDVEQPEQVCSTVDTWVGGSSCWNCAQAAHDAFGRGAGWHETSSSCSSGTLWTSCSATYCI
jgi:hypothetical protein